MRFIKPVSTEGLERLSPIGWRSTDREGVFVIDHPIASLPFVCFFVQIDEAHAAPGIMVDTGDGYDELRAVAFRSFPFGFYHLPLADFGSVRQLRFRASQGRTAFRCVMFQTAQPLLVAVLHYLFNLRYQKIGLVAPAAGGAVGTWAQIKSNISRIRQFFSTVSAGKALRVQQNDSDVFAKLCLMQQRQVEPVQAAVRASLAGLGEPLISFVVPVYNTQPEYLNDLLASFEAENAPYAELILVDDGSTSAPTKEAFAGLAGLRGVRFTQLASNRGIAAATNAGIETARGDWVSFIDHDDTFIPGAIAIIAQAITDHPAALFFYTDEVVTNVDLKRIGSFCKPAYDSVMLSGLNYINHFSVFRRSRLADIGGLSLDCEGSQDYDLLLRYLAGAQAGSVVHIPFLAYAWRRGEESYSSIFRERSVANARRALKRAYAIRRDEVEVEAAADTNLHRVRFPTAPKPLVSIVIPNRDSYALITRLVADLQTRTDYADYEIIISDNGTRDPEVLAFYEAHRSDRFHVDILQEPFNFSRMCNRGVQRAKGEVFLFLNNDIEVIAPDWLSEMVECLAFESTGIVGAKLLYPNGNIQHAGVMVGLGEAAGHWYVDADANEPGPMGRLAVRQTIGAVTGACMLVTRACFEAASGFDEDVFPIAYNDVDLCVRARHLGYRTVWTPFATLYHHESASRGSDEEGENNTRLRQDMLRLQERHGTKTLVDDAYSPFYDRRYSRPHLIVQPALPQPRVNAFG